MFSGLLRGGFACRGLFDSVYQGMSPPAVAVLPECGSRQRCLGTLLSSRDRRFCVKQRQDLTLKIPAFAVRQPVRFEEGGSHPSHRISVRGLQSRNSAAA